MTRRYCVEHLFTRSHLDMTSIYI